MARRARPEPQRRAGFLCDGCHQDAYECMCGEIARERAREYGPICRMCNGGSDNGYADCEFASSGVYEAGPGSRGTYGCPRMTGTF